MKKLCGAALVLTSLSLVGCAQRQTIYSWGGYEDLLYKSYSTPGSVPPERGVEQLEADYQRARAQQKPVPPGFHAQLGYLYFQMGNAAKAQTEFETEKSTFPESAVLMNRFLAKLKKS